MDTITHSFAQAGQSDRTDTDVLRLRAAGYSARRIADSLGLGRTSARNYLERAEKAGLSWPDVANLDEDALEHRLFGREARPEGHRFVEPDWAEVNQELKRPGVTLLLLWEEYRARHPSDGYAYSAYCQHYRAWVKRLSPSMRQRHVAPSAILRTPRRSRLIDWCQLESRISITGNISARIFTNKSDASRLSR